MKVMHGAAALLVVIGALNWGLIGFARFDLVAALFGMEFGQVSAITAIVYALVGLAGLYQMVALTRTPRRVAAAVAVVLAAGLTAAPAHAQSHDIVDTAVNAGSFTTLAKALTAADLVTTLKSPGPFTVFAPTDAAFAKLPAGTLENLLKPENKAMLRRVLTYHVVPGKVMAADVVKISSATAVSGDTLSLKASGGAVTVDKAQVVKTDIAASNGVIHVLDTVLLPPGK